MFDPALTDCIFSNWSPRIGDPTALGWATVVAYALAALLVRRTALRQIGAERWLWLGCALLLAALTVNKQLDLQSFLTAAGRCHAKLHGWYDDRGAVQRDFIYVVAAVASGTFLLLVFMMRRTFARNAVLFAGLLCLLSFIAIRAAGFHHFDVLLGLSLGPFRMNHVLELGGIGLNVLAAILHRPDGYQSGTMSSGAGAREGRRRRRG